MLADSSITYTGMEVLAYKQQHRQHYGEEEGERKGEDTPSTSSSESEEDGVDVNIENQPPNLLNLSSSSSSSSKQLVFIESNGFHPKTLEVEVNTTIEFRLAFNVQSTEHHHRLTGASLIEELNFKSPLLQKEDAFTFTPSICGEISVSCPIYTAGILCQVLVKAPASPRFHTATSSSSSSSSLSSSHGEKRFQFQSTTPRTRLSKKDEMSFSDFPLYRSRDAISCHAAYGVWGGCRLQVETFSFELKHLSIKQGTTVEFTPFELENDVMLSCGWEHVYDEFDEFENVILPKNSCESFFHTFATMGKFKVVNKNFSWMSCIIDVNYDQTYFDTNSSEGNATKGAAVVWYPVLASPFCGDNLVQTSLARPHNGTTTTKSSMLPRQDSKTLHLSRQIHSNVSLKDHSQATSTSELHQAVTFSQLNVNNNTSPTALSKKVTSLLESLSSIGNSTSTKNSLDNEENMKVDDIESGGSGAPGQLTRSQKRKIRKKIGKAKAKDKQDDDENEDEIKPATTIEEARDNVFNIDTTRESDETESIISELLETSSSFSTPGKSLQCASSSEDMRKNDRQITSYGGGNNNSVLPSQSVAVLPDWNARPNKYRSFIDPNFRNTVIKNGDSLEDGSKIDDMNKEKIDHRPHLSKADDVRRTNEDDLDANVASTTASILAPATVQQAVKPTEKKKKKEKKKKVGWQMSDSFGSTGSLATTKTLTLEEIEEEQLRLDLLKIAELEAEETKAKEKAAEEAKAEKDREAASLKEKEEMKMKEEAKKVADLKYSCFKEKAKKENTRRVEEKEREEDVIKSEDVALANKGRIESTSSSPIDATTSHTEDESFSANTSKDSYLEQEERDLQTAIEESKRFAEEEAKAKEELRRAEAKIREAADARARAEKKIADAKAKSTKDVQTLESIDSSPSGNSILIESQRSATRIKPLSTVESILLQRFKVVEYLHQGSTCHDVLPSGKKHPLQVISNSHRTSHVGGPSDKGGFRRNHQNHNSNAIDSNSKGK